MRCRSSGSAGFYSQKSRRVDLDALSTGSLSMSNGLLRGERTLLFDLTSVAVSEGRKVRPQVDSCLCNFVALISIFHVYGSSELLTCT